MEKPLTEEQIFEADVRNDETFKERLNRAKKPITMDLVLAQHIADIKADMTMEHSLYLEDRRKYFEGKKLIDEMFQELSKHDRAGVYAEQKAAFDETFAAGLGMIKHQICPNSCLVAFSNSLSSFAYQTMGKSFQTNLKDLIQKKFDDSLSSFAELFIIAEKAGINPMERIQKKMQEHKEVVDGKQDAP